MRVSANDASIGGLSGGGGGTRFRGLKDPFFGDFSGLKSAQNRDSDCNRKTSEKTPKLPAKTVA
jgi:hypothetical protein